MLPTNQLDAVVYLADGLECRWLRTSQDSTVRDLIERMLQVGLHKQKEGERRERVGRKSLTPLGLRRSLSLVTVVLASHVASTHFQVQDDWDAVGAIVGGSRQQRNDDGASALHSPPPATNRNQSPCPLHGIPQPIPSNLPLKGAHDSTTDDTVGDYALVEVRTLPSGTVAQRILPLSLPLKVSGLRCGRNRPGFH